MGLWRILGQGDGNDLVSSQAFVEMHQVNSRFNESTMTIWPTEWRLVNSYAELVCGAPTQKLKKRGVLP